MWQNWEQNSLFSARLCPFIVCQLSLFFNVAHLVKEGHGFLILSRYLNTIAILIWNRMPDKMRIIQFLAAKRYETLKEYLCSSCLEKGIEVAKKGIVFFGSKWIWSVRNEDIKFRLNQERFLLNRVQNEVFVYSQGFRYFTFFEQLRNPQGLSIF